ncbi:MAG: aldo/keto reductase [Burkholderiales bacterium]|nr:aldo/keto reductase [Burkholderiales bacterium]
MKMVSLPSGAKVPALGLGTWRMGENARARKQEVAAVRFALEAGYRLIDTAEMYGEGGAEEVIGAALADAIGNRIVRREELFIVSKVYPHNASRQGVVSACERSLKRLGIEHIDLYLLHWRGQHALSAAVEGFEALRAAGRIRHWGVSNLDAEDMEELWRAKGGSACAANQVYYSASERGVEFDLLPWQRRHRVPLMAYCPIDQGAAAKDRTLGAIGAGRGATAAQVALAWVLRHPDVIAIPKAVREEHLRENLAAAAIELTAEELTEIDRAFPPPNRKRRLAMA